MKAAWLIATIFMASAALASSSEGYVLNIDIAPSLSVVDNGTTVCRLVPDDECYWPMAQGSHRVELVRSDGAALYSDYQVTDSAGSLPMMSVKQCDFTNSCGY